MSARLAGYTACGASLVAIFACLYYVPVLWCKLNDIRTSLDLKMDEFKVLEQDIWSEMMQTRINVPKPRKERQAPAKCNCNSQGTCPPGPPGLPGLDGQCQPAT
jgi:hypothetical protein